MMSTMSTWDWVLIVTASVAVAYLGLVATLVVVGRRSEARAVAGFVPDCAVLFRRLLGDPRVSGRRRMAVLVLVAYLASPIDLVPDFIPVAGQLDDLLAVVLVLRLVLRGTGPALLREHWPGPDSSRELVIRLAWGKRARA